MRCMRRQHGQRPSRVRGNGRDQPRGSELDLAQQRFGTTLAPLRSRKPPGPSLCRPLSPPKLSLRSMDHRGMVAHSALHAHRVPDEYGSWRLQHQAVSTSGQPVPHAGARSAMQLPVRGQVRRSRLHTRLRQVRSQSHAPQQQWHLLLLTCRRRTASDVLRFGCSIHAHAPELQTGIPERRRRSWRQAVLLLSCAHAAFPDVQRRLLPACPDVGLRLQALPVLRPPQDWRRPPHQPR
jgi:hypothetical protein